MAVFVLDKCKEPLMPTSEKRARLLLQRGRAVVIKMYPFTIRLKDLIGGDLPLLRVKIDPGSQHTGVAVVREKKTHHTKNGEVKKKIDVLNLFQINHRGKAISEALTSQRFNRLARFDNRTRPKDAASIHRIRLHIPTLEINCTGRGSYKRTRLDKYGFPRAYLTRQKSIKGFQTGDQVKAIVTKSKKIGKYTRRVAVRTNGNFNITTRKGTIQGINHKYCKLIACNDGYGYGFQPKMANQTSASKIRCHTF